MRLQALLRSQREHTSTLERELGGRLPRSGDRYVDVVIALEGDEGAPVVGRVGADECPVSLRRESA